MSEGLHFLKVKTLSVAKTNSPDWSKVIWRVLRHNLREIQAEWEIDYTGKINKERSHQNVILSGPASADEGADLAYAAMIAAGVMVPRKNATMGAEIVFSLPSGLSIDYSVYFSDALEWAKQFFPVQLLSAVVHADEDHPHMHVVLLPIRDGCWIGSKIMGDRKATRQMHRDFHERVGKRYGFGLPTAKKYYPSAIRDAALQIMVCVLQKRGNLNALEALAILKPHHKNMEPLLTAFGLPMPTHGESFVSMMTKECSPESPNRSFNRRRHFSVAQPEEIGA